MKKKRQKLVQQDRQIDAILKKARLPAKVVGKPEQFKKRLLKRIGSNAKLL
jgi:hypothetical protein